MIDKQRAVVVAEIERMEDAIRRTKSKYLMVDYTRAVKRLKKELRDYDRFKQGVAE